MPRLVDTTIRVLGQEPLAGLMPTADLLRLAEVLDGAGFAYLEVSGGGVFDSAVHRGVDAPRAMLAAVVRKAKERGELPKALDPDATARLIIAFFQGLVLQQAWDARIDVEACADALAALIGVPAGSLRRAMPA